ncbi:MAG: metal-sensitive transcriptional regulator [Candidatus Sericytochromatia bacterium]
MAEDKIIQHLRRIEGQVKGIQRMITEERQCDEILTQIMAIHAALDRVTTDLVQTNMATCFDNYSPEEVKERMAKTIGILCKM